jgi:hypothetical protein
LTHAPRADKKARVLESHAVTKESVMLFATEVVGTEEDVFLDDGVVPHADLDDDDEDDEDDDDWDLDADDDDELEELGELGDWGDDKDNDEQW